MAQCRKCNNRNDCWIKNVIEFKTKAPSEEDTYYNLVKSASSGHCQVFEEKIKEV